MINRQFYNLFPQIAFCLTTFYAKNDSKSQELNIESKKLVVKFSLR